MHAKQFTETSENELKVIKWDVNPTQTTKTTPAIGILGLYLINRSSYTYEKKNTAHFFCQSFIVLVLSFII